ncbi:hypothetical protein LshimejAT787_3500130 [Lyophyllum shimeji]|uniref:Uncharacterized protein n=1 Tax=Lyophyllum shimeji TaxID=47721 RepID=A0A9P3PZF4_LYOSH|nr:hypothetical protein LshimejAT787_3500130 [Lyophyllum shimeji]
MDSSYRHTGRTSGEPRRRAQPVRPPVPMQRTRPISASSLSLSLSRSHGRRQTTPRAGRRTKLPLKRTRFGHRQQPAPPVYPCKEPAQYPIDNDTSSLASHSATTALSNAEVFKHSYLLITTPQPPPQDRFKTHVVLIFFWGGGD